MLLVGLTAPLVFAFHAFVSNRLWDQEIWSATGSARFCSAALVTAILAVSLYPARSRLLALVLAAVAFLYTVAATGPPAAFGAIYWLCGAWCLGRLCLRLLRLDAWDGNGPGWLIELPAGFAAVALFLGFGASLPIHKAWLHMAWPAVCIAAEARSLPSLLRRLRRVEWRKPCSTAVYFLGVPAAFLLFAHWQAALMPEVSTDGLAMHLNIAAWMAAHGSFHFDVTRALWAVSPMAGDWLYASSYLVGGEAAARLVNFACLLALASLTYWLVSRWARPAVALLSATLFLSTPVAYLVTGSLFVENSWTLFLLSAVLAFERWRETEKPGWLAAAGALAGSAVAGKFGALFCLLGLGAASVPALTGGKKLRGGRLAALGLLLVFAAPPYIQAWARTGNPTFPYFNHVFRSPLMDATEPLRDSRWGPYLHPDLLYRIPFESHRFLEAMDGTGGFHLLVLWPAALLALRRRLPYWVLLSALAPPLILVIVFSGIAYLRYVYPIYVLVAVLAGWLLKEAADCHRWLGGAAAASALVCCLANTWFLGGSGWYNKDFALNTVMDPYESERFLTASAPQRRIIDYFNRAAPGKPVAFLEDNATAGFLGRAYTASWHTLEFAYVLKYASSAYELGQQFERAGIQYAVAAVDGGEYRASTPALKTLLAGCGEKLMEAGRLTALRLRDHCPAPPADADAGRIEPPASAFGAFSATDSMTGPGLDDTSGRIRYLGRWFHDRQFPATANHSLTYSNQPAAAFELQFEGESITWVYTRAFNRGKARVLLNGKQVAIVDLYAPTTLWQQRSTFPAEGSGPHVFRVEVTGEKHPASEDVFVDVDLLEISPPPARP